MFMTFPAMNLCILDFRRRNPVIIKLKNGIDYFLLKREGEYYLLTDQKEKTDSSFEWWRTHYRKKIDPYDECVEECYDVSFHVIYDVGIPGVTDNWILLGDSDPSKGIVYLNDGNNHEGWEFVDRNWSRKRIDFCDVKDQYLEKKISIKNGRKCDPKRKERVYMSKKEFAEFWMNSL